MQHGGGRALGGRKKGGVAIRVGTKNRAGNTEEEGMRATNRGDAGQSKDREASKGKEGRKRQRETGGKRRK